MKTIPLETVAEQARELVLEGHVPSEVADALLPRLNQAALRIIARQWLSELAEEIQRVQEYRVRREATRTQREVRHGNKRTYDRGCRCAQCVSWIRDNAAAERNLMGSLVASIMSIVDDYATTLKVEWTAEILESTFGTSAGRVTWGEATVSDHENHIAMDVSHISGYMEDAAMHKKAIEELKEKGATCLNEALALT